MTVKMQLGSSVSGVFMNMCYIMSLQCIPGQFSTLASYTVRVHRSDSSTVTLQLEESKHPLQTFPKSVSHIKKLVK
jgi:hypothetical protein